MSAKRILVVDNLINDAMLVACNLEDLGHEVMGASSGREALELAATERPDLIVLSAVMPEMDGIDVCYLLKENPDLNSIPVILVASKDQEKEIVRGLNAGADDFLLKPSSKEALEVRVNLMLRSKADHDAIIGLNEQLREETTRRQEGEEAQSELLSKTFMASIEMLVDFMELLQPDCVGRTVRISHLVKRMCSDIELENAWEMDVATMLSQVGCILVPREILKKVCEGEELTFSEKRGFWKHPETASDIIRRMPRMQRVARIIAYQERYFNGDGPPFDDRLTREMEIPHESRILKLAIDFDTLVISGATNHEAIAIVRTREDRYDPKIVEVLATQVSGEPEYEIRALLIEQLRPGMVLADHVLSRDRSVLIRNGKTLTRALLRNLQRYRDVGSFRDRVREPMRVQVPVFREQSDETPAETPADDAQLQST